MGKLTDEDLRDPFPADLSLKPGCMESDLAKKVIREMDKEDAEKYRALMEKYRKEFGAYKKVMDDWKRTLDRPDVCQWEDDDYDDPFHEQVGGSHYVGMAIQPIEYIHRNGLGFCEGLVIKYVSRWENKGGIEDLQKAIHTLQLLIDMEQEDGDD